MESGIRKDMGGGLLQARDQQVQKHMAWRTQSTSQIY